MDESVWQKGPLYLTLPKAQWPFSWEFLDTIPEQELRRSKALFNLLVTTDRSCALGSRLTELVLDIMQRTNSYAKSFNVTARVLKAIFDQDRSRISKDLTVKDITVAKLAQFMV